MLWGHWEEHRALVGDVKTCIVNDATPFSCRWSDRGCDLIIIIIMKSLPRLTDSQSIAIKSNLSRSPLWNAHVQYWILTSSSLVSLTCLSSWWILISFITVPVRGYYCFVESLSPYLIAWNEWKMFHYFARLEIKFNRHLPRNPIYLSSP